MLTFGTVLMVNLLKNLLIKPFTDRLAPGFTKIKRAPDLSGALNKVIRNGFFSKCSLRQQHH